MQTDDCSPTWWETGDERGAGRRIRCSLANISIHALIPESVQLRLCSRGISEEAGFQPEVCSFTDDVILFVGYWDDGITKYRFKSESRKLKHQNGAIVCVSFPASESRCVNVTHNLR